MTDNHPLVDRLVEAHPNGQLGLDDLDLAEYIEQANQIVRSFFDAEAIRGAQTNVRFPEQPDVPIEVAGNFILSSYGQMQMVLVGTEPVVLIQPEYDAEEGVFTLITTAVDLPPAGLVTVLEALLDGVRTIVAVQEQEAAFATYDVVEQEATTLPADKEGPLTFDDVDKWF